MSVVWRLPPLDPHDKGVRRAFLPVGIEAVEEIARHPVREEQLRPLPVRAESLPSDQRDRLAVHTVVCTRKVPAGEQRLAGRVGEAARAERLVLEVILRTCDARGRLSFGGARERMTGSVGASKLTWCRTIAHRRAWASNQRKKSSTKGWP